MKVKQSKKRINNQRQKTKQQRTNQRTKNKIEKKERKKEEGTNVRNNKRIEYLNEGKKTKEIIEQTIKSVKIHKNQTKNRCKTRN